MQFLMWLWACQSEKAQSDDLYRFYEELQEDALVFGYEQGNWSEDYGDAAAFGPSYYVYSGQEMQSEEYLRIAQEAADYNLFVVQQSVEDNAWMLENMEEVFMAIQGLIEYTGVIPNEEAETALEELISKLDVMLQFSGDYIEVSVGDFASSLYGPTSITSGFIIIQAQYANYIDPQSGHLDRAKEVFETIDEVAWNDNHYRFGRDIDTLYLYPNATMLIALNRMYQLTGEVLYLDRAEDLFQGIQPLYDESMQFYFSPYSQESQGAQTDEYSTLSSQNYLILGLILTYENTGDASYLEEALRLLKRVKELLYDEAEGKILHHWIDGRAASHDDKTFFCAGCNLQVLYILWYLKERLGVDLQQQ